MRKLAQIALTASAPTAFAADVTLDSVLATTMKEVQASLSEMGG